MSGAVDDPSIEAQELIYRHIARRGDTNMLTQDESTGQFRARSGAFVWDDDGCSCYLDSILSQHSLGPSDVKRAPDQVVIAVTAQAVRDVQFGITRDAWPPDAGEHPRQAAHALIINYIPLSKKKRSRANSDLAKRAQILEL